MESKVMGPSIGLIVLGILGVLGNLWGLFGGSALDPEMFNDLDIDAEQKEMLVRAIEGGGGVMSVIAIGANAFIAWAGFQMMKLKAWTAAVVANVVVMVPCLSCCCLIGIPIGIWGLVVLFNKDVKNAFEGQAPM